jgi:hypothetical protein
VSYKHHITKKDSSVVTTASWIGVGYDCFDRKTVPDGRKPLFILVLLEQEYPPQFIQTDFLERKEYMCMDV